jgi:hypothetical protein
LRFGARLALPSPAEYQFGSLLPKLLSFVFRVLLASLVEFDPRMFGLSLGLSRVRSLIKSFAAFWTVIPATGTKNGGASKY